MEDNQKLQGVIRQKRKILQKLGLVQLANIKTDKFYFNQEYNENGGSSLPDNEICEHSRKVNIYDDINVIKEQMDVLSIMYNSPFVFRGKNYKTFNHVYYSEMIRVQDKATADKFNLESNDPVGWSEQVNRSTVPIQLTDDNQQKWTEIEDDIIAEATEAILEQCPMAHDVLIMTYPAQLWQCDGSDNCTRLYLLEALREKYMMLQSISRVGDSSDVGRKRQRVSSQNPEVDDDDAEDDGKEIPVKDEYFHDLNEYLKIRLNRFKFKAGVDIRAYWNGNPTKKGARLTEEDWMNLKRLRPTIDKQLHILNTNEPQPGSMNGGQDYNDGGDEEGGQQRQGGGYNRGGYGGYRRGGGYGGGGYQNRGYGR